MVQGERIADVVAVNQMHHQPQRQRGLQGLGADQIAAVDRGRHACLLRLPQRPGQCVGAVMAVRNDADLHLASGGSLKSLVVFVFLGIAAYMTLRGLLGAFRVGVLERASITLPTGQDLPSLLARASGMDKRALIALVGAPLGGALLAFAYSSRSFRANFDYTLGGVVVGLVVIGGWLVSGVIGHVAEDPNTLQEAFVATNTGRMESFSFVAPLAFTLEYFMLWTDKSEIITYGIASVAGVIAGSAAFAIASGRFRWEGFRDAEDTANHIVGGLLMGFGGITALGCTIGQGISGFSTLALGSMITFLAIVAGSAVTMKYQYWRVSRLA